MSEAEPVDPPTARPEYARRMVDRSSTSVRRLIDVQAPYRAHVRRICRGLVLDVGCGIGRNLGHLGSRAVGVDHNADAVAIARQRGHTAYLPADFVASSDGVIGAYDTMLLAHVVEHLPIDEAAPLVSTYLPYLRPSGRVVLICPQERGYSSDPTHVAFFDFAALQVLCRRVGLLVRRRYSFPLPRLAGRLFTYNEFVVIADRPRAVLS